MRGIIYKVTNILNSKVYIGQTIRTLAHRKGQHKFRTQKGDRRDLFHTALLDEGFSTFTWEQIDTAENQAALDTKERKWITYYKSDNPQFGYNSKEGGSTGFHISEEHKRKIGDAQRGEKNHNFGKKATEETRRKKSNTMMGNKHLLGHRHSDKTLKKMRESHRGKKAILSEATVRQIKIDLQNGMRICDIVKKYNVGYSYIANIKNGHTWAWLKLS